MTASNEAPLSFDLEWTPSFDGNRPHLYFELNITSLDYQLSMIMKNITRNTSTNKLYTVSINEEDMVLPFTHYAATVTGCNIIGCGNPSKKSNLVQTKQYSELLMSFNVILLNSSLNTAHKCTNVFLCIKRFRKIYDDNCATIITATFKN